MVGTQNGLTDGQGVKAAPQQVRDLQTNRL